MLAPATTDSSVSPSRCLCAVLSRATLARLTPAPSAAIAEYQGLAQDARKLTPAASTAVADYQALAQNARKLVAHADAQVESLAASVQATLAGAQSVLGEDSPVRYDPSARSGAWRRDPRSPSPRTFRRALR